MRMQNWRNVMVKMNVNIDEDKVVELATQQISKDLVSEYHNYEKREAKIGIRYGVEKAVKDYIYSNKAEIIERVVDRASKEIVRKGLPKLLERIK